MKGVFPQTSNSETSSFTSQTTNSANISARGVITCNLDVNVLAAWGNNWNDTAACLNKFLRKRKCQTKATLQAKRDEAQKLRGGDVRGRRSGAWGARSAAACYTHCLTEETDIEQENLANETWIICHVRRCEMFLGFYVDGGSSSLWPFLSCVNLPFQHVWESWIPLKSKLLSATCKIQGYLMQTQKCNRRNFAWRGLKTCFVFLNMLATDREIGVRVACRASDTSGHRSSTCYEGGGSSALCRMHFTTSPLNGANFHTLDL